MNLEFIFFEIFEYFFTFEPIKLQVIKSNKFRTNPISKNLFPPYCWSRIKRIKFELFFIEFFEYFMLFESIKLQFIESNKFQKISI